MPQQFSNDKNLTILTMAHLSTSELETLNFEILEFELSFMLVQ